MKNNKLKVETVIPWKLDYNTVCTRIIKKKTDAFYKGRKTETQN